MGGTFFYIIIDRWFGNNSLVANWTLLTWFLASGCHQGKDLHLYHTKSWSRTRLYMRERITWTEEYTAVIKKEMLAFHMEVSPLISLARRWWTHWTINPFHALLVDMKTKTLPATSNVFLHEAFNQLR